jgi:nucleotide-binding universal stress UspA family protein
MIIMIHWEANMPNVKPIERIIWAVDPFAEQEMQKQAIMALRALTEVGQPAIEPVYVLTPNQVNVSPDYFPGWEKAYKPIAEKQLKALIGRCDLKGLAEPEVIVRKDTSVRRAVDALVKYAQKRRADLIAVSTHARKGAGRFFVGSFAETLFLHSTLPVYISNPSASLARKIDSILFAADLTRASAPLFEKVVTFARQMEARLTVYHHIATPLPTAQMPVGFVEPPNLRRLVEEHAEEMRATADKWAEKARKQGVMTDVIVDEDPSAPGASIVGQAERRNASMIALVAQTGAVASLFLGSTTRQVVRNAHCPIWVLLSE